MRCARKAMPMPSSVGRTSCVFEKTVGAIIIENSEPGIYRGMLRDRNLD